MDHRPGPTSAAPTGKFTGCMGPRRGAAWNQAAGEGRLGRWEFAVRFDDEASGAAELVHRQFDRGQVDLRGITRAINTSHGDAPRHLDPCRSAISTPSANSLLRAMMASGSAAARRRNAAERPDSNSKPPPAMTAGARLTSRMAPSYPCRR